MLLLFIRLHAAPLELDVLRQQYDTLRAERVTLPYEAAIAELNRKFTVALDAAAAAAKQSGKLDDVLAIQADRKVIEAKQPPPAEDLEGTPEALGKLRGIYREQFARIEAERAANQAALDAPFTGKLQELEVTLTRADRIEDATLVRKHRESLALARPASVPVAPAAPPTMPAVAVTPAVASSAPARKGDDRKAAEWVLEFAVPDGETHVVVSSPQGSKTCRTLAELPDGDFVLISFNLSGFRKPLPRPVTNEETMVLAGLQHLSSAQFNKIGVTDEGLRFAATCPELYSLYLHNLDLTDEVFAHFTGLKKLARVVFNNRSQAMTGVGFRHIAEAALVEASMPGTGLNDEGIAHLVGFDAVRTMDLTGTKITDEGVRALAAMKGLESLNVSNTAVTPAGLLPLKSLNLKSLSFGRPTTWDELAPDLPALAAAFPKVEETSLPRFGTYTAASIEPLVAAFPKLRYLEIEQSNFEPGTAEAIAKFTKLEQLSLRLCKITDADLSTLGSLRDLEHLNLNDTAITDAGLANLVELKSLKSLMISETKTTSAGLAKFQEERPDVKIQSRYYTHPR